MHFEVISGAHKRALSCMQGWPCSLSFHLPSVKTGDFSGRLAQMDESAALKRTTSEFTHIKKTHAGCQVLKVFLKKDAIFALMSKQQLLL